MPMNILLVEDDEDTVEAIHLCFKVFYPDAVIFSVTSGKEALTALQNRHLDIALIDMGLPDMDGIELLKNVRERSNVPVIVISARNNPDGIAEARRMGIYEYITKPFDYKHLIRRIKKAINR